EPILILVAAREPMEHRAHVVRKVLRPPYPPQARGGVPVEQLHRPPAVPVAQPGREAPHISDSKVETLGAGGRNDVRGIAGKEQPAVLHRLDDEAAHRRDALFRYRAVVQGPAVVASQSAPKLLPDPIIRPALD